MERKLDMQFFKDVLGEDIPLLPLSDIGRYRLLHALRFKFGPGFKLHATAQKLLAYFDREVKLSKVGN